MEQGPRAPRSLRTLKDPMTASPPRPPLAPSIPTRAVLGFDLYNGTRDGLVETLLRAAVNSPAGFRAGYLNAAQSNLAEDDPAFASQLRAINLLYADGQSIIWASRWLGEPLPERLSAADFIGEFLIRAAQRGVSLALLGGHPGSAGEFARYWRLRIPSLEIRYEHDGFFAQREEPSILTAIEEIGADIVLVGMGAPRQEAFVARAVASGGPRVWWCVGALFEYGDWGRRRAPRWMRRYGLEWAFRLAQEPRRLAGRYLLGNPRFVLRALRYKKRRQPG